MRRICTLFLFITLLFSCSDDNSDSELESEFPAISDIPDTPIEKGSILQINGTYNPDETYIVTFNGNVVGKIIEITASYLKVEVHEKAQSGDIKLTYNGQTKIIGKIEIIQFPEIIDFSELPINIGDILTIHGSGFLINETYTITFEENVIGNIKEVETNLLKVEIPENAVSGDVSLTFKGETRLIGTIDILVNTSNIYAYKRNYSDPDNYIKQIVKIDKENGSEELIADLNISATYYEELVFDKIGKNIIGFVDHSIVKINIETGQSSTINLQNDIGIDYQGLVIDDSGNIYAYKRNYSDPDNYIKQIVKIDKENGSEELVADLNISATYYEELVFDKIGNNIIGLVDNSIVKVNIETGQSSTVNLQNDTGIDYQGLVIDDNGKIYAYKRNYSDPDNYIKQIVKIDKENGNEELIADLNFSTTYYKELVFDSIEKNILGFVENTILKVNIETGQSSTINLQNDTGIDYQGLVINNN